jgi:hypothetical protein
MGRPRIREGDMTPVRTAAQHICVTPTNFEITGELALGLDIGGSVWLIDNRGDAQYITDRT